MNIFKKLSLLCFISVSLFFFASLTFAAAPDGAGPWADSVLSSSQGLMKNGSPVPAIRSNPSSALGVAEANFTEGNFFSLGFGGSIALGFDNGVSNGAVIIETTNPGYPGEVATVAMSEDGVTWVNAGTVTQDGIVNQPAGVTCARFVRITDASDPNIFSDATADGYDVDGVQATGDACTSPSSTPAPTSPPSNSPTNTPSNGPSSCTPTTITTVPTILETRRVSPTSISVSWGPDAGFHDFIVQYGFTNGNWQFSSHVSGFTTTINDLPANQSIWIRVAATDNCATGAFGAAVSTGGTTFTTVPGFPNTGNPRNPKLPNTGIGPDEAQWNIPNEIEHLFSLVVSLQNHLLFRAFHLAS